MEAVRPFSDKARTSCSLFLSRLLPFCTECYGIAVSFPGRCLFPRKASETGRRVKIGGQPMSRERFCGSGSAPALPLGAAGRGSFLLGGQIVPALDVFVILLQARFELSLGLFEQRRAAVGNVLPL